MKIADKVRIKAGEYADKTGVIIMDGGKMRMGFRKPGEGVPISDVKMWIVKLDSSGEELPFVEGTLIKI